MAKRVSPEEKIAKIVAFFRSKPEFYTIKELGKLIPKVCGISSMQVDEYLNAAIDENLITKEKMGSINVYWSFEKQDQHYCACENEKLSLAIQNYESEKGIREERLRDLEVGQEDTEERRQLLKKYLVLKKEMTEIEDKLRMKEVCSIEQYKQNQGRISDDMEQINKITDDIFTLQSYISKRYGMDRKELGKKLGIPEDFDYVE